MSESCLLAMSSCSASSVGPQRRRLAGTPALAIPGTSLWKNHPGLHTARALFPSHLLSRPHRSRKTSMVARTGEGAGGTREGIGGLEGGNPGGEL